MKIERHVLFCATHIKIVGDRFAHQGKHAFECRFVPAVVEWDKSKEIPSGMVGDGRGGILGPVPERKFPDEHERKRRDPWFRLRKKIS